jgi:DNA adenine methylase
MGEDNFRPVTPVRPAVAYIGGKRRLGEQLARRIEAVEHSTYAEPFVGMGGVFFRRRWAPRREVINDISRDVATLFRILASLSTVHGNAEIPDCVAARV